MHPCSQPIIQVAISEWLKKGWDLFKKDAGLSIVFTVIAVVAYVAAGFLIPFGIGSMVISVPLFAGFIIIALMLSRNQQSEFVRYFWGFRHLVPLLLFTIVSTAFIFIGLVLFGDTRYLSNGCLFVRPVSNRGQKY